MHWIAHLFGWNHCESLIDHDNPKHNHEDPKTWRMGVRCLGCGEEKWFD